MYDQATLAPGFSKGFWRNARQCLNGLGSLLAMEAMSSFGWIPGRSMVTSSPSSELKAPVSRAFHFPPWLRTSGSMVIGHCVMLDLNGWRKFRFTSPLYRLLTSRAPLNGLSMARLSILSPLQLSTTHSLRIRQQFLGTISSGSKKYTKTQLSRLANAIEQEPYS